MQPTLYMLPSRAQLLLKIFFELFLDFDMHIHHLCSFICLLLQIDYFLPFFVFSDLRAHQISLNEPVHDLQALVLRLFYVQFDSIQSFLSHYLFGQYSEFP